MWLNDENINNFYIEGYGLYYLNRSNNKGGGVAFLFIPK